MAKYNIKSRKGLLLSHLIQMSLNKMLRIENWMIWKVFVFKVPPQYRIINRYDMPNVWCIYNALYTCTCCQLPRFDYVKCSLSKFFFYHWLYFKTGEIFCACKRIFCCTVFVNIFIKLCAIQQTHTHTPYCIHCNFFIRIQKWNKQMRKISSTK